MKKLILIGCLTLLTACLSPSADQTLTSTPPPPSTATLPPPPIPATQTPEPTPTLEPSPTPLPRFFTDEFDSSLAGWVTLQAGNDALPEISVQDGKLFIRMNSPYTWVYALYGAESYADVRVDAQVTNNALSPASIGLICRYSEEDGWFEYNITTDGTYNVLYGRWLAVGIADYLPILSASSSEVRRSGEPHEIGLNCSGTILSLYINQKLIRRVDVARYDLTEGRVGLTVSSFENTPVIAAFDWAAVGEP
jgi:hypothetical protein